MLKKLLTPLAVVLVLAASLIFVACGGGGDDEDVEPTEPAAEETSESTAEATEPAEADEETVTIDEEFWHAGWKVTLGEATFSPRAALGSVTIDAVFENLSPNTSSFNSQLVLTADGENYEAGGLGEELPNVPGGLSGNGTISFDVTNAFSFDDAVLIIGNTTNNQAIVPIGDDATEELVTLEPQEIAVSGAATAGALTVNVEQGELRADLPDRSNQVEKGKLALSIYFSATPQSGIAIGQGVLQSQNVALRLPDGTAVAVITDGVSGVNVLLQRKEGTTIPDLRARFEVPSPAAGQYAFILRGNYGPGGAMVEAELPFTITAPAETSSTPAASTTPAAAATP